MRVATWSTFAAAVVLLTACAGETSDAGEPAAAAAPVEVGPALKEAAEGCAYASPYAQIGDDGYSVTLDGEGDQSAGLPVEKILCVLRDPDVDVPDAVISQMERTRALDGTRDATWGPFTASWSYHPDRGLDVIVVDGSGQ